MKLIGEPTNEDGRRKYVIHEVTRPQYIVVLNAVGAIPGVTAAGYYDPEGNTAAVRIAMTVTPTSWMALDDQVRRIIAT